MKKLTKILGGFALVASGYVSGFYTHYMTDGNYSLLTKPRRIFENHVTINEDNLRQYIEIYEYKELNPYTDKLLLNKKQNNKLD